MSATEMTADNVVVQCVDASGAEWCDQLINLQTTANQLDDLAAATNLATVDTVVDAIKVKTDSLTFTQAGQVDANITYVNGTQVQGTGATGNEWGPV